MFKRTALAASIAPLLALAAPASATTGGVCFRMANVPSGDTLNLRARPSARAAIVARYANSSEVIIAKIGRCGRWCKVAMHDGAGTKRGWVNARYLHRSECP
jgi:uncharacterized protein YraI